MQQRAAGLEDELAKPGRLHRKRFALEKKRMKRYFAIGIAIMATTAFTASAADGKALYEAQCARCHGKDAKGQTAMGKKMGAKDYTDAKVQEALSDEAAFKAIKDGFKDKEGKVLMKPSEGMSDEDIKSIVAYLRTFKK
jgi:mono/diheme cytochrome c family protein